VRGRCRRERQGHPMQLTAAMEGATPRCWAVRQLTPNSGRGPLEARRLDSAIREHHGPHSPITRAMQHAAAKLLERARAVLYSPRAPRALALLALLISLPSLAVGFQLDDRMYRRLFASGRSPLELLHESHAALAHEKQLGVLAWWSSDDFSLHFLRPGTALTHWLEYRLWPDAAWLMHLGNCLVYAALVAIAALLYRELMPNAKLAGLGALMFTVDESHAQSVGWIASRHVLLSSLFALSSLLLHVRARSQQRAYLRWTSVLATALALASAEYGVAGLAYLSAYAAIYESGPLRVRLRTVWPHLALGALWAAAYFALGCGVRGALWYRDPFTAPAETFVQGLADLPLWLLSQLGGDVANLALVMPQWLARALALLLFLPLLWLLLPPVAATRHTRFFASGMLLSCLILFATVPQDRLTLAASFGGFGWIAGFFGMAQASASKVVRSSATALLIPHLFFAPLGYMPILSGMSGIDGAARALADAVPSSGTRQAIAINVPLELLTNAAYSVRSARDAERVPLHQLYAGFSKLRAARPDEHTLELSVEDGWGTRPIERMFTARHGMPGEGEVRDVAGMRATVLAVDDHGSPKRVRFEFADALETPGRVWLVWNGKRPARWRPPPVGADIELPAASLLSLL
jgi:hypothetical protein